MRLKKNLFITILTLSALTFMIICIVIIRACARCWKLRKIRKRANAYRAYTTAPMIHINQPDTIDERKRLLYQSSDVYVQ